MSGSQQHPFTALQWQMMGCILPTRRSSPMGASPRCSLLQPGQRLGSGAGTICHKQHHRATAGPTVHLVPLQPSQAGPRLVKTSFQSHQARPRLGKTSFTRPPQFSCQTDVSNPMVDHIKVAKVGILLSADCTNTVLAH